MTRNRFIPYGWWAGIRGINEEERRDRRRRETRIALDNMSLEERNHMVLRVAPWLTLSNQEHVLDQILFSTPE